MPTQKEFRRAVLERRPELTGKLWLNRLVHNGADYTVTVRGVMTFFWVGVDETLDVAVQDFFIHLDDARDLAAAAPSAATPVLARRV